MARNESHRLNKVFFVVTLHRVPKRFGFDFFNQEQ